MPTVEELTWPFIGLSPEDLAHGNIPDIVSWIPLSIVLSIIRASKHAYTLSLGSKNFVTAFILLSRRCP